MQEIPPIRQLFVLKDLLRLVAPGVALGLLIVALVPLPRASALSLALGADAHLPLLPPIGITSTVSLLEPSSPAKLDVAAGQSSAKPNTPPHLIDLSVVASPSPVGSVPPVSNTAPSPEPSGSAAPAKPADKASPSASASSVQATPATHTNTSTADSANAPKRRNFLGFTSPDGFGSLPDIIGNKDNSFRVALIVLTSLTALLLVLATITTTKLTRGSPGKV